MHHVFANVNSFGQSTLITSETTLYEPDVDVVKAGKNLDFRLRGNANRLSVLPTLNDRADWFDMLDTHQLLIQATVKIGQLVRVQPHLIQNRRVQVLDMEG